MDKKTFTDNIIDLVSLYLQHTDSFDSNPQLRVNPLNFDVTIVNGSDMLAEIGDNDEAIEDAAAAQGAGNEEATQYQVYQNPDFYTVATLIDKTDGKAGPSLKAIDKVVANYF